MKFQILYIDPPWKYNSRANHKTRFRGGADGHYPLMAIKDIKAMPIADIAKDRAILFMWATFPFLKEQLEVIEAWGFKYTTIGFLWVKLNPRGQKWPFDSKKQYVTYDNMFHTTFFGVGFYSKSCCEPCLIATRGRPLRPISNKVSSLVISPRGEHSRKPNEVRDRIIQLYGDVPRIELFGRPDNLIDPLFPKSDNGWVTLGNAIDGKDIRESIGEIRDMEALQWQKGISLLK